LWKGQTLLDFYTQLLAGQAEQLRTVSNYLVVDAFFAKHGFVSALQQKRLHLIPVCGLMQPCGICTADPNQSRPADSAHMPARSMPDNPIRCIGSVLNRVHAAYQAVLYSKSLKTALKVTLIDHLADDGSLKSVQILACTDTALSGRKIWHYYRLRFQQEFLFRDGKQHLGLGQCQSPHAGRINFQVNFQVNFALTVLSIAKVFH